MNCARCRVSWELCAENKVFLTLTPRYLKGLSVRPYVRARDFHGRAKKHGERPFGNCWELLPYLLTLWLGASAATWCDLCAHECASGAL